MRYFYDDPAGPVEITEGEAKAREAARTAHVVQGGSGVVPEHLRQPGETPEQYGFPWLLMAPGPLL